MSNLSSINFKKSIIINTQHNDRTLAPSYLISDTGYEINLNSNQAQELKQELIKNAIEKYSLRTGQKFQAKSYEWSAVVNIKPETTMQDLEALSKHFSDKYGFQCYQIAIHRDEGHINEQGEKVLNQHAHLEFITLDKETGKNNYRRELITPKVLREIQTEVSKILQMERGTDKRISKRERIEPRKYAQMKEQEKAAAKEIKTQAAEQINELKTELEAEILSKKELKEKFEAFRKENANQGLTKEFFKELGDEKKKQIAEPSYTQEQLNAYFTELLEKHTTKKKGIFGEKKIINYEEIIKEQQKTISDLNAQKQVLKQITTKSVDFIDKEVENALKAKFEALKQQNEIELNQKLQKERQKLQNLAELTLKKKEEFEKEQELYRTKYQELSQDEVIKQIEANKNQEINKLKSKNTGLEKENENLKQENSKLKLLLLEAEELKEIIKEQLSKELEKAKEQIKKLSSTIQRAMQMSFVCSYDRKNKYEIKHIYFKDFTKQSDQEQESTMQSNIKAVKDRELEKQREEQVKKQVKARTNRGFER
ncbi:mobilization protein [Campylobacter geochelonis]|uniref:mobilization protein n=1 Tax=Campylobacter geochelonis TaxID=1780362 RepID=UPI0007709AB6|nr:mobilization protein [Campylobacter geochelonis]CZE51582.1 mobilization protein [Campylobacter geochelonis]